MMRMEATQKDARYAAECDASESETAGSTPKTPELGGSSEPAHTLQHVARAHACRTSVTNTPEETRACSSLTGTNGSTICYPTEKEGGEAGKIPPGPATPWRIPTHTAKTPCTRSRAARTFPQNPI